MRLAWFVCLMLGALQSATAQRSVPNASVSGHVDTPSDKTQLPIAGIMVTLHRVGTDSSGAIDSVRTDAAGRYTIQYTRPANDESIYFAAAVYRGIAYFSAPLKSARANGDEAAIAVFDTSSRPRAFPVQGHHLVVAAPRPDGVRDVVEVWELANDTTLTIVGRDSLSPVWTAWLPKGAQKLTAGQGDVGADAIVLRGGRVAMIAPFGPGVKQISYTFSLPSSAFPLVIPLEQAAGVLEVLVEEPGATVKGGLLRSTPAATTQGRTFKRFLGQDVPRGEDVRITVPTTTASNRQTVLIVLASVIALLMAFALWRALGKRGSVAATPVSFNVTDALVAEIAALDARQERPETAMPSEQYSQSRAALMERLSSLLAAAGRTA